MLHILVLAGLHEACSVLEVDVTVDSLSLRATPVFLTANPSIRTFAEAGTL
eukprot:COSAG02_NODE_72314_length_186_cov_73.333333_1_plen_50_part_10